MPSVLLVKMKTCTKCNEEKELLEFYEKRGSKDGRSRECKTCLNGRSKEYQKSHPEMHRTCDNRWKSENKDKIREAGWKSYGIDMTVELYNDLFEKQKGRCAICGTHQVDLGRALSVDHNHETGEINGLLCSRCNNGLGCFRDDVKIMKLAIVYLERHA